MPERLSDDELDAIAKDVQSWWLRGWIPIIDQAKEANRLRERCEVLEQLIRAYELLVEFQGDLRRVVVLEEIAELKSKLETLGEPKP